MIPVGTLCVVIRARKEWAHIIGSECVLIEHKTPYLGSHGVVLDCKVELKCGIRGDMRMSSLLPISPDSTITREEQREVVV